MSISPLPQGFYWGNEFISLHYVSYRIWKRQINMENTHEANGSYILVHQKWKWMDPWVVFRIPNLVSCSLRLNGLKVSKVFSSFCMRRLMELPRMTMMTLQFSFWCSVQINIEQLSQADKQINTYIDEKILSRTKKKKNFRTEPGCR